MKFLLSQSICILTLVVLMSSCGDGMTFNDQITNDIKTKMGTGICKDIPSGSIISNIKIGEIVPIEGLGTDVTIEFDYEVNGETKHHSSALLYVNNGSSKKLGAIGGCEYEMK